MHFPCILWRSGDGDSGNSTEPTQPRDITPPLVKFNSPTSGEIVNKSVIVTGFCEENNKKVKFLGNVENEVTTSCNQSSFNTTLILSGSDGPKNIIASQTDAARNEGRATLNLILDTVAPILGFTSHSNQDPVKQTIDLEGTCETDLIITFSGDIDGSPTTDCANRAFQTTINLTSGDGPKNIIASQTDAARMKVGLLLI